MTKEKILKILEEKFGHRRLFGIGLILIMISNMMFIFSNYVKDLKYVFCIANCMLILIGISAIIFASEIRHKKK